MNRQENVKKFEELLSQVDREGMPQLLEYIRDKSDFYTAPASTRFHLSTEGGLLQHSLNVYECLQRKAQADTVWHDILTAAGKDALIICPLLHDLCKTHFYKIDFKNQKTYDPEKVKAAERWQVKKDNAGAFIWESGNSEEAIRLTSSLFEAMFAGNRPRPDPGAGGFTLYWDRR